MTKGTCASTIALFVLLSWTPGEAGSARFPYLSPLPGSSFVPVNSAIAFRTGATFQGGVAPASASVVVRGAGSGAHGGRLVLSDDFRTLVFYPDIPFKALETVTVSLAMPSPAGGGEKRDSIRYSFITGPDGHPVTADGAMPGETAFSLPHPGSSTLHERGRLVVDSLPQGFPSITVITDSGAPPLSIFLSNFPFDSRIQNIPFLMTLGTDGTPGFARRMPEECFDFKRQPNGLYTYHDKTFGYFFALDSTFTVVDSFKCGNGYPTDDHELRLLADGHALLLGYDLEPVRMDTIVQGGDSAALVYGLILQELDRSKNVVFQWRSWDHFRITDAIGVDLTAHMIDYVHGNAIEVDGDSNIVISSRHLSEITKINRQTGEIMWRWGGKNNQFTFTGDSTGFSYQHMIRRLPDGHWTLFDNGNFHAVRVSRAVEYALDEQQRSATLVWQFRHTPDLFSMAMGSVQRLEDGNTLIGWGATNPSVSLVTPGGRTLREFSFPQGIYSYRAFGIASTTVTSAASPGQVPLVSPVLEQNYPNPFNPSTTITYRLPAYRDVSLVVYNTLGQEVRTLARGIQPPGSYVVRWDGSNDSGVSVSSGVYIYRLRAGSFVQSRRMILLR